MATCEVAAMGPRDRGRFAYELDIRSAPIGVEPPATVPTLLGNMLKLGGDAASVEAAETKSR